MSAIPFDLLKGSTDLSLPFISRSEKIDPLNLKNIAHDTLLEFGFLVKNLRIINKSAISSIFYRTQSVDSILKEVPPSSDETIDGWFSIFQIFPDLVDGDGLIEYDLTRTLEALKNG